MMHQAVTTTLDISRRDGTVTTILLLFLLVSLLIFLLLFLLGLAEVVVLVVVRGLALGVARPHARRVSVLANVQVQLVGARSLDARLDLIAVGALVPHGVTLGEGR